MGDWDSGSEPAALRRDAAVIQTKTLIKEAAKRQIQKLNWDLSKVLFDRQMEVYNALVAGDRYICLRCGRRGGKSFTWAAMLIHYGLLHPKSTPIFVCMTRQDARDIIWPALDFISDQYNLGLIFNRASGDVTIPQSQSVIKIRGAGSMLEINKIRGKKYPIAIVDEAQAFGPDLGYLLDEALEPALADYHGPLCISGTPNVAAVGPFFDIDQGKDSHAWSHWTWTFFDNPTMPDPQGFIKGVMLRRRWTEDHPSFRREYLAQWIHDDDSRAFKVPNHAVVPTFPEDSASDWQWVLGVDVGYHDPFAFVVIAASQALGQAFVVDCYQEAEITTMEALTHTERFCAQYPITEIAIDTGGAGRLVAEDWKKLTTLPIKAADKTHKASQVDVINGDFAAGKLLICRDNCLRLIGDLGVLEWDSAAIEKNKFVYRRGFADHLADGLQYAYNLCTHHSHMFEEARYVKPDSPEYYLIAEQKMEQAALLRVEQEQSGEPDVWSMLADSAGLP
jgi:hypothetical protein